MLRGRRGEAVMLGCLAAVVAALVLGGVIATRRTASVHERSREFERPADVTLQVGSTELADQVIELESVSVGAVLPVLPMFPVGMDEFAPALADRSGAWLRELDRPVLAAGAVPDPSDPSAALVTDKLAKHLGVWVGDPLPVRSLSSDEAEAIGDPEFVPRFEGVRPPLRVAGVVRLPSDEADPNVDWLTVVTQAFWARYGDEIPSLDTLVNVRLAPGFDAADLAQAVTDLPGGEGVAVDTAGTGGRDAVGPTLRTATLALGAVTAAAALAGLASAGQTATRLAQRSAADAEALAAVGLTRRQRAFASGMPALVAIVAGICSGYVLAPVVASRLVRGLAARIEPDPGVHGDWFASTVVGVLLASLLGGLVVGAAWVEQHRSRVVGRSWQLRLAGISTPAAAGAALAFARTARRTPVRQAVAGALIGGLGVSGVLVFGANVDRALADHETYGWGWDASLSDGLDTDPPDLERRGVTDAALVTYDIELRLNSEPLSGLSIRPQVGHLDVVLIRGERPRHEDEVLVGERTLDDLGLALGDRAQLAGGSGTAEVRVVGTTVLPASDSAFPIARGVVIDPALGDALGIDSRDAFTQLAVAVDGDARVAFADLQVGDEVIFPAPPVEVGRLDEVSRYVNLLAGFLAALAVVAVVHAVVVTIRRRARDLAVLRTIGFTRSQIRQASMWQAALLVVPALAVSLPLGVVLGRIGWRFLTESLGLPFAPTVPVLQAVGVATLAAVAAILAGWLPIDSGRRPADALRAE